MTDDPAKIIKKNKKKMKITESSRTACLLLAKIKKSLSCKTCKSYESDSRTDRR